jgi:hypothetical protein
MTTAEIGRSLKWAAREWTAETKALFALWRRSLKELALITAIIGMVIVMASFVSIASDINAMRANQIQSDAEIKAGVLSRLDSFLWKTDTLIKVASTLENTFGVQMQQVRTQVKEASDDATHETKMLTTATTKAVTQALATTNAAVAAVGDQPPPTVNVESPKPVIVPAPTVVLSPIRTPPPPSPLPEVKEHDRWWKKIWPFPKTKAD